MNLSGTLTSNKIVPRNAGRNILQTLGRLISAELGSVDEMNRICDRHMLQ
jgi:hypothetical protein